MLLFSNIFIILKPCLGLERKKEDFCVVGYAGENGIFDSVLNLKYLIQAVKFQWPTLKLL
jgi:hypothetical protein